MLQPLMSFDIAELFAAICTHALDTLGDKADSALIAGVTLYGTGRGTRMRQRALRDGYALDPESYLIYGEFEYGPGESGRRFDYEPGQVVSVSLKCPWVTLWDEKSIPTNIRRYYCDRIDEVIFDAFMDGAPYKMTTIETRSRDGADICRFGIVPCGITPQRMEEIGSTRAENIGNILMPWEYHVAHLYYAMKEGMEKSVGRPLDELFEKALADCAHNGQGVREAVAQHEGVDFMVAR